MEWVSVDKGVVQLQTFIISGHLRTKRVKLEGHDGAIPDEKLTWM